MFRDTELREPAMPLWWTNVEQSFNTLFPWLENPVVRSLIFAVAVVLARTIANWRIRRVNATTDDRRRWLVAARNFALLGLILGLFIIWSTQLQSLLLSVVAIAASIVLATKEFILCLGGALYRTVSDSFSIGDRIEINGQRGDVIDHGLLTTTLLEVGPGKHIHQFTGRSIVIPNSQFLLHPLMNETYTDDYVLHTFSLRVKRGDDWRRQERELLDACRVEATSYLDEARSFLSRQAARQSVQQFSYEPRVWLELTDADTIELLARVPVPARQNGRIEQLILRRFLDAHEAANPAVPPVVPPAAAAPPGAPDVKDVTDAPPPPVPAEISTPLGSPPR